MGKANHKGRSTTERHSRLSHNLTGSAAWRDLSGSAVKLLVALQRLDRGPDNGNLFLSVRKGSEETGMSQNTVVKAFRELEAHGFIAAVDRGHFKVKGGAATTWRLTFVPAPARSKPASNEWLRWSDDGNKTRAQNLTSTGAKIDTPAGNAAATGAKNDAAMTETSHVSISTAGANTDAQVVCHRQGASDVEIPAWKQAKSTAGVSSATIGDEQLADLRNRLRAYLEASPVGEQGRLASSCSIPGGTLSKFLAGRGLSCAHFVNLQLALKRPQAWAA